MEDEKVVVGDGTGVALPDIEESAPLKVRIGVALPVVKDNRLACALCHKPLGLRGSSPAIKLKRSDGAIAYGHQSCARRRVGLR
jgi:hypothetical protein